MTIHEKEPQTAWVTITDRTDTGELSDHLFSYSWPGRLFVDSLTDAILESYLHVITGDEYVAHALAPYLGREHPDKVRE